MKKVDNEEFQGATVQECLKMASISFGVPIENLKYSIIEEKKGLFKKHAVIAIEAIDSEEAMEDLNHEGAKHEEDGTIEINQGRIIIKNPKEAGRPALISACNDISVVVNGEKITTRTKVYEDSVIEVLLPEEEAKRYMNLRTNADNMETYVSISYKPKTTYKLRDTMPLNSHLIEIDIKEEIMPPKFTETEIKDELLKLNIKYGILKMNIMKCTQSEEISELLIAAGKKTIDGIDDRLEIKYTIAQNQNPEVDDNKKDIDYKAIGTVESVEKGQVLGILHPGKDGVDGVDVTGRVVKAKTAKKVVLAVGEGAQLLNQYTAVAVEEGRPSLRGSTFFVYKLHEVSGDVGLKSGNITFVGDVVICGNVNEGMKVEAGNSILIKQNVTDAEIIANGDVTVRGNVIHSNVNGLLQLLLVTDPDDRDEPALLLSATLSDPRR